MSFFSNLKKVLNIGSADNVKKKKPHLFANIKCDVNPEDIWEIVSEIGDGAFGKVHKARHKANRDMYAAAKICGLETEEELEDFTVEIDILSEISHANVIQMYEAYYYQDKLWSGLLMKVTLFVVAVVVASAVFSQGYQSIGKMCHRDPSVCSDHNLCGGGRHQQLDRENRFSFGLFCFVTLALILTMTTLLQFRQVLPKTSLHPFTVNMYKHTTTSMMVLTEAIYSSVTR